MEAAGGVTDEEVCLLANRFFIAVEAHGRRIAVRRTFDQGDAETLRPHGELLHGGSAESVRRSQHDLVTASMKKVRELRRAGRFSGAVDSDHQKHPRPTRQRFEPDHRFRQNLPHMLTSHLDDVRPVKLPLLRLEVGHDLERQARAEITGDERRLEFVPIDVGLGETLEEGLEKTGHARRMTNSECGRMR